MINKKSIFVGIICGAVCVGGAFAASDNGCGKEDNDRITAELALCTTHAYNIGLTHNPTDDSDKQLMRDVVALKTTVMTQQMYKQYEYLDATMRRLKTQLEKAILTTKLQAAGAATTDGATSTKSSSASRNVVLSGAYDCIAETSRLNAMNCLQRNLAQVRNAISGGNMGDAKRQLEKDIAAFDAWKNSKNIYTSFDSKCKSSLSATRNALEDCVNNFGPAIAQEIANNNKTDDKKDK